jgi:protein tyrosine/serine phosphatase
VTIADYSSDYQVLWIDLDGAANVRDLGGLPTADGARLRPGRLIRSDNLQGLSAADVTKLVDDLGVRSVADLRTSIEVNVEGPGPLERRPEVEVRNLSLYPDDAFENMTPDENGRYVLPWENDEDVPQEEAEADTKRGVSGHYLNYLNGRADSIIAALRMIAGSPGATIVHCAAGKDRTGVVVAIALTEVGISRDAIIADYARSSERIEAIFARLAKSETYAGTVGANDTAMIDKHKPRDVTMERLFAAIDGELGGVPAWLRAHGWTEADAAALRAKLLD